MLQERERDRIPVGAAGQVLLDPSRAAGRVMLVDDDVELRDILASALADEGFLVTEAANGTTALEKIRGVEPELILLNADASSMDGYEICRRLRSELGQDVPIVLCSKRLGAFDRIDGLRAGADDYVVKPFSVEELLLRIRSHVRRTRRSRADGGGGVSSLLSGRLEDFATAEVLQMIGLRGHGKLMGRLRSNDGRSGRVYIRDNFAVHAELGRVQGAKAFTRLLGFHHGTFVIDHYDEDVAPSMAAQVDHALIQALVQLDEERVVRDELARRGIKDRLIPTPHHCDRPTGQRASAVLALIECFRSLHEVLDLSPYTDVETLRTVRDLFDEGALAAELPS